jgi:hypothetical protein
MFGYLLETKELDSPERRKAPFAAANIPKRLAEEVESFMESAIKIDKESISALPYSASP